MSAYVASTNDATFNSPPFARGSRGINILPDMFFSLHDCTPVRIRFHLQFSKPSRHADLHVQDKFDLLVIPGGAKGAETISTNSPVQHLVRQFLDEGKFVGMICAGMSRVHVTGWHKLTVPPGSLAAKTSGLPKQPITSHPSVKSELENSMCCLGVNG